MSKLERGLVVLETLTNIDELAVKSLRLLQSGELRCVEVVPISEARAFSARTSSIWPLFKSWVARVSSSATTSDSPWLAIALFGSVASTRW